MPDYKNLYGDQQATTFPPEIPNYSSGSHNLHAGDDFFGGEFDIKKEMASIHDDIYNSHGLDFPIVGGNIQVDSSVHPEIAAAAYNDEKAVIVHEGDAFLAPFDTINTDAVELACNEDGCALIPDDGNPHNDIHLY